MMNNNMKVESLRLYNSKNYIGYLKKILFYLLITVCAFIIILPFIWMITTSLKGYGAIRTIPIKWIPKNPTLDNYKQVFNLRIFSFWRSAYNSFFLAITNTFVMVMSATMAAFVFAKVEFKHREKIFLLYLSVMMIPETVTLIPNYTILNALHLLDTFLGVIVLSLMSYSTAVNIFIMRQSMKSVSNAYIEAAGMDGASMITIFFKIMIPMCKPTLATITLMSFMASWNAYLKPLIILSSNKKITLQLALATMSGQMEGKENVLMAGAVLTIIPILLVYIYTQRFVDNGIDTGGVKA